MGTREGDKAVIVTDGDDESLLTKGTWTPEEDSLLAAYVKKHGGGKWKKVQKAVGINRSAKSCRLRWINHLRPNLRKGAFSNEEAHAIVNLHARFGNKWAQMALQLPGRTDNEIKNYVNALARKTTRANTKTSASNSLQLQLQLPTLQKHCTCTLPTHSLPQLHQGEATSGSSGDSDSDPIGSLSERLPAPAIAIAGTGSVYNVGTSDPDVHGPTECDIIMKDCLRSNCSTTTELPHGVLEYFSTPNYMDMGQPQDISSLEETVYGMRESAPAMYLNDSTNCIYGSDQFYDSSMNYVDRRNRIPFTNGSSVSTQSVLLPRFLPESCSSGQWHGITQSEDASQCGMYQTEMLQALSDCYIASPGGFSGLVPDNFEPGKLAQTFPYDLDRGNPYKIVPDNLDPGILPSWPASRGPHITDPFLNYGPPSTDHANQDPGILPPLPATQQQQPRYIDPFLEYGPRGTDNLDPAILPPRPASSGPHLVDPFLNHGPRNTDNLDPGVLPPWSASPGPHFVDPFLNYGPRDTAPTLTVLTSTNTLTVSNPVRPNRVRFPSVDWNAFLFNDLYS